MMFQQAFIESVRQLQAARAAKLIDNFALIGGFAVAACGVSRATADFDYIFKSAGTSRKDLAEYFQGNYFDGALTDPLLGSVSFNLSDQLGNIPVQLLQFPPAWEKVAFQHVAEGNLQGFTFPVLDWFGLILLKLYAAGPTDIQDVQNILAVTGPSKAELAALIKQAAALRVSKRLERILQQRAAGE